MLNKIDEQTVNLLTIIKMVAPDFFDKLTNDEIMRIFINAAGVVEAQRHLKYSRDNRVDK